MAVLPAAVHQQLTQHRGEVVDAARLVMLQGLLDSDDAFPGHVRDAYRWLRHVHCEAPPVEGALGTRCVLCNPRHVVVPCLTMCWPVSACGFVALCVIGCALVQQLCML